MGKNRSRRHPQVFASRERKRNERLAKLKFQKVKEKFHYGDTGWKKEWKKFNDQLAKFGLYIKDMAGDGNCLFRAIADQIDGYPNNHHIYRAKICDFISKNRELFEPFIEDDIPFETYLTTMRKNATWGGNIEIQAASLLFHVNISIYQVDQPRWDIVNWEDGARTIHLSYHQGDHYASVRRLDELKNSKTPSLVSKSLSFTKPTDNNNDNVLTFGKDKNEKSKKKPITKEELYIMETTGCQNLKFIRNVMRDNYNDINATIEFINLIGAKDTKFQEEYYSENVSSNKDTPPTEESASQSLRSPTPHTEPLNVESNNNPPPNQTDRPKNSCDEKNSLIITNRSNCSDKSDTVKIDPFLSVNEFFFDDTTLHSHSTNNTNNKNNDKIYATKTENENTEKKPLQESSQSSLSSSNLLLLQPSTLTAHTNKAECLMSSNSNQQRSEGTDEEPSNGTAIAFALNGLSSEEQLIMEMTNCYNSEFLRKLLKENGNNAKATVQTLLLLDPSTWANDSSTSSKNGNNVSKTSICSSMSTSTSASESKDITTSVTNERNAKEQEIERFEEKQKEKSNKKNNEQPISSLFVAHNGKPIHPKLIKMAKMKHQSNKERKKKNQSIKQQQQQIHSPSSQSLLSLQTLQQLQQREAVNPDNVLASMESMKI